MHSLIYLILKNVQCTFVNISIGMQQELAQLFTSVVPRQVRKMTNLYNTYNAGRGKGTGRTKAKNTIVIYSSGGIIKRMSGACQVHKVHFQTKRSPCRSMSRCEPALYLSVCMSGYFSASSLSAL